MDDAIQRVVDLLAANLSFDRVNIITFDLKKQQVNGFYKGGAGKANVVEVSYNELWDGLSGWVLCERQPALSPKGVSDERESAAVQRRRAETNCGAIMVIPILYHDEMLGTLTVINRPEQRDFEPDDLDLLFSLAGQVASTIVNHRLYLAMNAEVREHQQTHAALLQAQSEQEERVAARTAEYRKVEQTLRQSEERFAKAFAVSPDSIIISSLKDGRYLDVNDSFLRDTGYTREEIIGYTSLERALWASPEERAHLLRELQQQGRVHNMESQYRRKSGELRDALLSAVVIRLENGNQCLLSVVRDITERKAVEEALRVSEQRFKNIIDFALDAIVTTDDEQTIVLFNGAAEKMFGYAAAEMIGEKLERLLPLRYQAAHHGYVNRFGNVDSNRKYALDRQAVSGLRASGEEFPCEISISVITTNQHRLYNAIIRDISERKRAEDALRTSEERYRHLVENSHDLIQSVAPDGRLLFVNRTWLETLEYDAADLPGLNLWAIIHPDSRAQCEREFAALLRGQNTGLMRPTFMTKSGAAVDLEGVAVVRVEHGMPVATSAFLRNVTGQRQIARIQAAQFAVSRILAESPEIDTAMAQVLEAIASSLGWQAAELWLRDAADERLVWRGGWYTPGDARLDEFQAVSRRYTFSRGEGLPGRVWAESRLIWEADVTASLTFARASLAAQAELHTAVVIPIVQGSEVPGVMVFFSRSRRQLYEPLAAVLADLGRQIGQFAARKRAEAALEAERALLAQRVEERTADLSRANAELAQAVRAKDEFLANMSHELRTPLNAILALSESLLEQIRGPLNERQQASLQSIEASGHHLLALINDILDLSKVEAGQLDAQVETVLIADVCQASLQFVKEMASKKSLLLTLRLDDQPPTVEADPKRLKQILVNLLSNAVKFTPAGGKVSLEVAADAEAGVIRFAVQDTGIGIAPEDIARLFQPFRQLDSSLSRQHEGTGLGLALVHRLSELHGGSVAVESEVGKGSRFTVALPHRS
ncbi:MAG: PAS domain S-box protein, partial [Chloroflexales bacterium]|nr:PAS domain S-box protein [Chloroflexales bacterium]